MSLFDSTWLFMVLIAVAAGLLRGFSGFGAGLVMVPAFGLLVGPTVAVPTVVLLEVVAAFQLVPTVIRLAQWRTVAWLGAAACVTIPVGSWVLAVLDRQTLQRGISFIVLIFVLILASGWRYMRRPTPLVATLVGSISGGLTGAAGVGGPPVILFFLSGSHAAPSSRASLIGYFAVTQLVALLAFAYRGLLTAPVLLRTATLLVPFLLAIYLGSRLFGRVSERTFRAVALLFLFLVALIGLLLEF